MVEFEDTHKAKVHKILVCSQIEWHRKVMSKNNVFILGNGFSNCCGIPTAPNLLSEIMVSPRVHTKQAIKGILPLLYPTFNDENGKYPNIEELLNLCEESQKIKTIIKSQLYFPKNEIIRGITDYIGNKVENLRNDFKEIEQFCINDMVDTQSTIITFNWDTILELALTKAGKKVYYLGEHNKGDGITILKLHGSLNWVRKAEFQLKNQERQAEFSIVHKNIFYKKDFYPIYFNQLSMFPFIVPPVMNKNISGDLRLIWKEAYNSVVAAQQLHFIGYSLPEEDKLARVMLRIAKRHNSSYVSSNTPVIVTNPDLAICERFEKLIGGNINFDNRKFEDSAYVN